MHNLLDYMVITNAKWWNGLPADIRQGLEAAMKEAIAYGNEVAAKETDDFRAKVIADKKAQVIKLAPQQRAAWREAMLPVWKQFESEIGTDVIEAALAANR